MALGRLRWSRASASGLVLVLAALIVAGAATTGGAARVNDAAIARAGLLIMVDVPAGFAPTASDTTSHTDNIRSAKGVDGCGPYVTLQKSLLAVPQAHSSKFADATRAVGNEVDVFPNVKAATDALTLYAKPSIVGCLEHLFEMQVRGNPDVRSKLRSADVDLDRQDIAGLGDGSVVYEGTMDLVGTDGSSARIGVGAAAVRVGRAIDVVSYTTTGDQLTDVLTPAIDASVARLRSALT